jgi:hypothetical protein
LLSIVARDVRVQGNDQALIDGAVNGDLEAEARILDSSVWRYRELLVGLAKIAIAFLGIEEIFKDLDSFTAVAQ